MQNRSMLKVIMSFFGVCLLWFSGVRLLFLFFYWKEFREFSSVTLFSSCLSGLRFDLAVLSQVFGIPVLLFLITSGNPQKWSLRIFAVAGWFIAFACLFIQAADLGYYATIGRRISFEMLTVWYDVIPIAIMITTDYTLPLITLIVVILLATWGWWRLWHYFLKLPLATTFLTPANLVLRALLLLLLIAGGRGGFQHKPLSQGMAFENESILLGHLVLNAPFTVLQQINVREIQQYQWLSATESRALVRQLLQENDHPQHYPAQDYVFFRKSQFSEAPQRYNVVILIMESWTAKDMGAYGGHPEVTPFFDELSQQGRLYDQFFSNGTRSVTGLASILVSIPAFWDFKLIMSPFAQNNLLSLPLILKQYGYQTLFLHGGFRGTLGLHDFAHRIGYQKVIAKEDFAGHEQKSDGTWGIWDHYQFERLKQELDHLPEPFQATLFSSSSHEPFKVPDPRFLHFEKSTPEHQWLNVLRYSDWSLQQFFELAQTATWFKRTIFIITGDHTIHAHRSRLAETAHIPFLIYTPGGQVFPGKDPIIGSHVDMIPTILHILKIPGVHSSMGRNIVGEELSSGFALFNSESYLWFTANYVYRFIGERLMTVTDIRTNAVLAKAEIAKNYPSHQTNIKNYLAYLQATHNAVIANAIAPDSFSE